MQTGKTTSFLILFLRMTVRLCLRGANVVPRRANSMPAWDSPSGEAGTVAARLPAACRMSGDPCL